MINKNHITVAALLIAGTAFANAASPVITVKDASKDLEQGGVKWDATSEWLSGDGIFDDSNNLLSASVTVNLDLTKLGISGTSLTFSGSSSDLVAIKKGVSDSTGSIGVRAITNGLQFTWQGGAHADTFWVPWENVWNTHYSVGGTDYVTITLEANKAMAQPNGGSALYDNVGAVFTTQGGAAYTFSNLKALKTNVSYSGVFIDNDYVTGFAVTQGIAQVQEIKDASKSIVIPEPATFGLFAGLGALCLVGTRRFRRSK